jgi:hypothetical protein
VTQVAQQSVTKIISQTFVILVTPKAAAKYEILFNKQAPVVRRHHWQSDQTILKNRPILGNVAKTVAKNQSSN